MKINFCCLFFLIFLFPLRTEAGVKIPIVVTPREYCPYDSFPDNNNNNKPGSGYCSFNITPTGIIGSDDTYIEATHGYFYIVVVVVYKHGDIIRVDSKAINEREGTVNEIAALAIKSWGLGYSNIATYSSDPIDKICFSISEVTHDYWTRPEFGNECGTAGPGPGPDPEPDPGSCDLGGPYYLSHGSMDVYDVNGNEARVNINVTCSEDATLTFTAPNELDLGQNIVSLITLDGQQPDGLQLDFTAPGRPLVFASKLQTIGTPEAGTFDKVYLLQATIQ